MSLGDLHVHGRWHWLHIFSTSCASVMQLPMSLERSDFGRASIPVSLSENFCLYFADMYTVVEFGQFTVGLKQPYFCPWCNCQTHIYFSILDF